jgi:hypothetical protein
MPMNAALVSKACWAVISVPLVESVNIGIILRS